MMSMAARTQNNRWLLISWLLIVVEDAGFLGPAVEIGSLISSDLLADFPYKYRLNTEGGLRLISQPPSVFECLGIYEWQ